MSPAPANVRVLVRVRPLNGKESEGRGPHGRKNVLQIDSSSTGTIDFTGENSKECTNGSQFSVGGTITVSRAAGDDSLSRMSTGGYLSDNASSTSASLQNSRQFAFDAVHGTRSTQVDVFESIKGIVDAVAAGYNGTIVAYGQTGSGKTHTVFGTGETSESGAGLVQRSLRALFRTMTMSQAQANITEGGTVGGSPSGHEYTKTTAKASFFEIFNERVYDLLSDETLESNLSVREDATKGVYVEGLKEVDVSNTEEAEEVLRAGMKNRQVASTAMNRTSSRSHAVFVLSVRTEQTTSDGLSKIRTSKFTLVDLAGSERQKSTDTFGARLKEASMINKSLLCLGYVINALVDRENGKERHVPFRDSKLTFLLRDSWGGNSKTCLVATVSPSATSLGETLSTLKFAQRAKLIKNTAILNEDTCGTVAALQAEVDRLRAELDKKTSKENQNHTLSGGVKSANMASASTDKDNSILLEALRNNLRNAEEKVTLAETTLRNKSQLVNKLKRKLDEESMVRKFKQRRIEYLTKRTKGDICTDDEVSILHDEVNALRRQVENPSVEAVEWKLKCERLQEEIEQGINEGKIPPFGKDDRQKLEDAITRLLQEKALLEESVSEYSESASKMQNEIVDLLNEVERLECEVTFYQEKVRSEQQKTKETEGVVDNAVVELETHEAELASERQNSKDLHSKLDQAKGATEELTKEVDRLMNELDTSQKAFSNAELKHAEIVKELQSSFNRLSEKFQGSQSELASTHDSEARLREQLAATSKDNAILIQRMRDTSFAHDSQKEQVKDLHIRVEKLNCEREKLVEESSKSISRLENEIALHQETILANEENLQSATTRALSVEQELETLTLKLLSSQKSEDEYRNELLCQRTSTKSLETEIELVLAEIARTQTCIYDPLNEASEAEKEFNEQDDLIVKLCNSKSNLINVQDSVGRLRTELNEAICEKNNILQARSEASNNLSDQQIKVLQLTELLNTLEKEKTDALDEARDNNCEIETTYKAKVQLLENENTSLSHRLEEIQETLESQAKSLQSSLSEARQQETDARLVLLQHEKNETHLLGEVERLKVVVRGLECTVENLHSKEDDYVQDSIEKLQQQETKLLTLQENLRGEMISSQTLRDHIAELALEKEALIDSLRQQVESLEVEKQDQLRKSEGMLKEAESEKKAAIAKVLEERANVQLTLDTKLSDFEDERQLLIGEIASLKASQEVEVHTLQTQVKEATELETLARSELSKQQDLCAELENKVVRLLEEVKRKDALITEAESRMLTREDEIHSSLLELRKKASEYQSALSESKEKEDRIHEQLDEVLKENLSLKERLEQSKLVQEAQIKETKRIKEVLGTLEADFEKAITQEKIDREEAENRLRTRLTSVEDDNNSSSEQVSLWKSAAEESKKRLRDIEKFMKQLTKEKVALAFELETLQEDHDTLVEQAKLLGEKNDELEDENCRLEKLVNNGEATSNNTATGGVEREKKFIIEGFQPEISKRDTSLEDGEFDNLSTAMDSTISRLSTDPAQAVADDSFDENMFLPNSDIDNSSCFDGNEFAQKTLFETKQKTFTPDRSGKENDEFVPDSHIKFASHVLFASAKKARRENDGHKTPGKTPRKTPKKSNRTPLSSMSTNKTPLGTSVSKTNQSLLSENSTFRSGWSSGGYR